MEIPGDRGNNSPQALLLLIRRQVFSVKGEHLLAKPNKCLEQTVDHKKGQFLFVYVLLCFRFL